MAPMEQTTNSYVRTATHPIHGWEVSYHLKEGLVAQLRVHQTGDPDYISVVADYLIAVQQGLRHLLVQQLLPEGLATTKDGIMNQLNH